jgi:cell division protein FtsZ
VINNPGLVNVDFADVRTVMGEVGMAMMGSAVADGADRARQAAEQAVRSPLLEDVNLAGARGVLVNVTASSGLRMREYQEVMTTIKEFTADDALVIVGTVIDDAMDDRLRVTMIATGLGGSQAVKREQVRAPSMTLVEQPQQVVARTGTDNVGVSIDSIDYQNFDAPAVIRRRERGGSAAPVIDSTEIPAFLRKQAD